MAFRWRSKLGISVEVDDRTRGPLDAARRRMRGFGEDSQDAERRLHGFNRSMGLLASSMRSVARSLDVTSLASSQAFQLDKITRDLSAQLGLGAASASDMSKQIVDLTNNTGLSTQVTGQLVAQLEMAGQKAGSHLETLAELTGRYGVSAQSAGMLVAETRSLGTSITDLADDATRWQKQFQMPGMLAALPEVVQHSRRAITSFNESIVGGQQEIIESTLQTGAVYAKTFGQTMVEAVGKIAEHQNHFMQALQQDADVFIGLEKEFSPLTMSLMETGLQMEDVRSIIEEGKTDPLKFAESVSQLEEQLRAVYGPEGEHMVQRFHRQMIVNSSGAAREYISDATKMQEAQAQLTEARRREATDVGAGAKAFGQMTTVIRKTAVTAIDTFNNLLTLGKTIIGLEFADEFGEMFSSLNKDLHSFNQYIQKMSEQLRTDPGFQKWRPWIVSAGKAVIGFGAAVGVLATGLTSLSGLTAIWRPMLAGARALGPAGQIMTAPFKALAAIAGRAGNLASRLFLPVQAIRALFTGLQDVGNAFRDPNITGGQKLVAMFRGTFVGVVDLVDKLLLGIPTMIQQKLMPRMGKSLSDGAGRMFNRMMRRLTGDGRRSFSDLFHSFVGYAQSGLSTLRDYIFSNLATWRPQANEWGRSIGRGIGGIAKFAWDGIKELFKLENWKAGWASVTAFFEGEGGTKLTNTVYDIMLGIGSVVSEALIGLTDEILAPFGTGFEEVREELSAWGDDIATVWDSFKTVWGDKIYGAWLWIKVKTQEGMFKLEDTIANVWNDIRGATSEAVNSLISSTVGPLLKAYAKMTLEIQRAKYGLHLIDDEEIEAAEKNYSQMTAMADDYAKVLGDQARATVVSAQVSSDARKKQMDAARGEMADFENGLEARRDADQIALTERRQARMEAAARRRQATQDRIAARDRGRQEEAARFEQARVVTNDARVDAGNQVGQLIRVLEEGARGFRERGKMDRAERVGRVAGEQSEILSAIEDATSPEEIQQLLDEAKNLAGKTAVRRAGLTTTAPTVPMSSKTTPVAAPRAIEGASPRAPAPVAAPTTSQQQSMRIHSTANVGLALRGDAGRLFQGVLAEMDVRSLGPNGASV